MLVSQRQQAQDQPIQANGMVGRYHRTLNQMLGKVVGETQRDWDLHVPAAAAAYRASEHVVAGVHTEFHDARQRSSSAGGRRFGAPAGEK